MATIRYGDSGVPAKVVSERHHTYYSGRHIIVDYTRRGEELIGAKNWFWLLAPAWCMYALNAATSSSFASSPMCPQRPKRSLHAAQSARDCHRIVAFAVVVVVVPVVVLVLVAVAAAAGVVVDVAVVAAAAAAAAVGCCCCCCCCCCFSCSCSCPFVPELLELVHASFWSNAGWKSLKRGCHSSQVAE